MNFRQGQQVVCIDNCEHYRTFDGARREVLAGVVRPLFGASYVVDGVVNFGTEPSVAFVYLKDFAYAWDAAAFKPAVAPSS